MSCNFSIRHSLDSLSGSISPKHYLEDDFYGPSKRLRGSTSQESVVSPELIYCNPNVENLNLETLLPPDKPPLVRKFPPVSLKDTAIIPFNILLSEHGTARVFEDHDIVEVQPVISKVELGQKICAAYTSNGKAVIQQQSTRGCAAAATAMLIKDHGGQVESTTLKSCNLWPNQRTMSTLLNAGLKAIESKIDLNSHEDKLRSLKTKLLAKGSAIVTIIGPFGAHFLVVDCISECLTKVRLRDPYHGWEITVLAKAFTEMLQDPTIIQIC